MTNPGTPNDQPNQPNEELPTSGATYGRPPSPSQPLQPPPQYSQPTYQPPYVPGQSQPLQQLTPTRNRLPVILIGILAAVVLVGLSIFGTLALTGTLAGSEQAPAPTPTLSGAQISATSTAVAVDIQGTATTAAIQATPTDPLAGAQVLGWMDCSSTGTGCTQFSTPRFTTSGPFDLLWVCSTDYAATAQSPKLQITVFNSAGRQVDSLSEDCTGTSESRGLVPETLPAGSYFVTVQPTTGPSWFLVVLEGAPSQRV
jgi:hypothetical protein